MIDFDPSPGDLGFMELVNREARNDVTDEESAWFRQADVVEAWRSQLVMLLNKVEAQLSHHKAERAKKRVELAGDENMDLYLGYVAQAEAWRANALWFRKTLLDRLLEAKSIIAYNRSVDYSFAENETGRYEAPASGNLINAQ